MCVLLNRQEVPTQAETAALCSSGLVEVLATLMYEQLEVKRLAQHYNTQQQQRHIWHVMAATRAHCKQQTL